LSLSDARSQVLELALHLDLLAEAEERRDLPSCSRAQSHSGLSSAPNKTATAT
jgi:hypothetical protein